MENILELLKNEKVEWKKLESLLDYEQPSKYIVKTTDYDDKYNIPVLTAGQTFILGFTNENDGMCKADKENPVIIFDDFTTSNHWVDFNFKVKSSAMKILKPKGEVNFRYCYHYIKTIKVDITEHKRQWISMYSQIEIPIPSLETQEKIVKILDKFTNYVTELQTELQKRTKQYNYYRDKLLSEDYLNKVSEKILYNKYQLNLLELKDIINIKNGKDWKTLQKGDIPVYGSGGNMNVYVNKYSYDKPTVLIPRKGSIENIFYLDTPFWNVDTIFYTEIDDTKIIPKYFYYFMKSFNIKALSTDSTRPSLTQTILNKIKILLPPLEIQHKVVQVLDKFQELLQETKGLLPKEIEQRQKQYEYYREKLMDFKEICGRTNERTNERTLINKDFFKVLKEAADIVGLKFSFEVEWKTLGEIGEFINGSGMPKTMFEENGEIGAIHYGHIYTKYNKFVYEPIIKINEKNVKSLKKVRNSDLVIARTSENIEDVMKTVAYLGKDEVVVGGHSAIFRHNENPKYLSYVFNGYIELIKQKNKLARGVKVIEISATDMAKIKIPLPPLEVQNHIVKILDKFDTLVNDLSQGLPKEIELRQKQYEYYRERLLNFKR